MKWITHQTGAVIGAIALQMPVLGIGAAAFGAILPDVLDQTRSRMGLTRKQRQKIFNSVHRGSSHWFGWWTALFLLAIAVPMPPMARALAAGAAFGAISHVLLDMLTIKGVPLLPFTGKGKISLALCSTGKWGEYAFLTAMVAAGAYFMGDHIREILKTLA